MTPKLPTVEALAEYMITEMTMVDKWTWHGLASGVLSFIAAPPSPKPEAPSVAAEHHVVDVAAKNWEIAYDKKAREADALKAEIARLTEENARLAKAGMPKVRPEVSAFAAIMEQKLAENDHKLHWSNCTSSGLHRRMSEEADEVKRALDKRPCDTKAIARECADVANFAMMIADNCGGLAQPPETKEGK
jgi:hypothetical protein